MRPIRTCLASLAAVLAAATLATPASAGPIDSPAGQRDTGWRPAPAQDLRSADARDAADGRTPRDLTEMTSTSRWDKRSPDARDAAEGRSTADVASTVIEISRPTGFDWRDAAIGAGGATGLVAISLAGIMTLLRRRHGLRSSVATP